MGIASSVHVLLTYLIVSRVNFEFTVFGGCVLAYFFFNVVLFERRGFDFFVKSSAATLKIPRVTRFLKFGLNVLFTRIVIIKSSR